LTKSHRLIIHYRTGGCLLRVRAAIGPGAIQATLYRADAANKRRHYAIASGIFSSE
jgi:hypothetical protein